MQDSITVNLAHVRERIAAACAHSGRSATDVTLVAVTKTVAADVVRSAWQAGVRAVGENRVQEAREKAPLLSDLDVQWHMIGHLQGNKAGQALELFQMIHSVDSVALAERLSRLLSGQGRVMPVLLEVNIAGEAAKSGFRLMTGGEAAFYAAVETILHLPGLDVQGLMTVGPALPDPDDVRPHFARLRLLRDALRARFPQQTWPHLSMGMTDDFEAAICEGATIVRLGRAIFGPRPQH